MKLFGLDLVVTRKIRTGIPHELTVVIPRAELRKKCGSNGCSGCQCEIILSSVTIAHSPREIGRSEEKSPFIPSISVKRENAFEGRNNLPNPSAPGSNGGKNRDRH